MLLAVNMGNTLIDIGVLDQGKVILSEHVSTVSGKTDVEYAVLLHMILKLNHISTEKVDGAIIASVVPSLTEVLKKAVQKATGLAPLIVGPGVKNGLRIRIDDPKTLGSDIVVDAVGALGVYEAPVIVIDMGTATTITYLDRDKSYCGGAILPGLFLSLEALVSGTAQLPNVSLEKPGSVIGRNTVDAIKSGALYGQAAMIDGMIERIQNEKGTASSVVATGAASEKVIPYCTHTIKIDRHLTFHGLAIIYEKNSKSEK